MPADSLFDMVRRACCRYHVRITDIGDLDYDIVRPILLRIESPEKLHQLEQASPQLIGRDAELWMNFIKRDIPDWHLKLHEPEDPKEWYNVYRTLQEEARKDSTADEAMLKAALASIKSEKEQNMAEIASRVNYGPSGRSRSQYNHYLPGRTGSKAASKMTLMEKIRKEAREARATRMNRPMHELPKRATTVTKPPQQFVEELKQKTATAVSPPPARRTVPVPSSRPPLHAPKFTRPEAESPYNLTKDREARLRAMKNGQPLPNRTEPVPEATASSRPTTQAASPTQSHLTPDFLEDSGEDEVESPSNLLKVNGDDRPRSASPLYLSTPAQRLKRKVPPSPFIWSARKLVKRPETS